MMEIDGVKYNMDKSASEILQSDITPDKDSKMAKMFNVFDKNNDGKLDKGEIDSAMGIFGGWNKADKDGKKDDVLTGKEIKFGKDEIPELKEFKKKEVKEFVKTFAFVNQQKAIAEEKAAKEAEEAKKAEEAKPAETVSSEETQNNEQTQTAETAQETTHEEQEAVKAEDIKDGEPITVQDEIGNTQKIHGEIKTEGKDEKSGYPEKILIGDKAYKFEKADDDGKAIYRSMQGAGQTYKTEWQENGIVLTQREGLAGTTQDGLPDITSANKDKKSAQEKSADAKKAEVDSLAKEKGLKPTYRDNYYYDEKEKMHYRYKDGQFIKYPNIKYFNKDGSYRREYINKDGSRREVDYGKDGYPTGMQAHNFKDKPYLKMEKQVQVLGLRKTLDKTGKNIYYDPKTKMHYQWDENKHYFKALDKKTRYISPDGFETSTTPKKIITDKQGNIKEIWGDEDWEYDSKGHVTKSKINGKLDNGKEFVSYNTYDENGNNTKSVIKDKQGNLVKTISRDYDDKGHKTKSTTVYPNGTVKYVEYDENNNPKYFVLENGGRVRKEVPKDEWDKFGEDK